MIMGQLIHRVYDYLIRWFSVQFDRRCEKIGLRILNDQVQANKYGSGRTVLIAKDEDRVDHVAAVWLSERVTRRNPISCAHLYEYDGKMWRSAGGGSGPGLRERFTTARPSSILIREGESAVRSYTDRLRKNSENTQHSDVGWAGCSMFYTAAYVEHLEVHGRLIAVPEHGHVIVAWKGMPTDTIPQHPPIKVLDKGGACLAEFGPNDFSGNQASIT